MTKEISASVRQRLRNLARERHEDFDYVLRQFVMQRLLYRLGASDYGQQFLLKGALLFWIWDGETHRPTRDIDLLRFGDNDAPHLVDVFSQIAQHQDEDGLIFDIESIRGVEIKEDADYTGVRITGFAYLANARIPYQVDIAYGDTVIPAPETAVFPSFLNMPAANLRIYPVYGVVAEKFQAMVLLGIANSRMKDFYDIHAIASKIPLDGQTLSAAVKATFEKRKTPLSKEPLYIFSDEFKHDAGKQKQWRAFIDKNGLATDMTFSDVVTQIFHFLGPIYQDLLSDQITEHQWLPEQYSWM